MIPALKPDDSPVSIYVEFLAELGARGFEGDISAGYADRTVQATDNSIYQRLPRAIVFPRHATDVVRIGKLAAEDRFGGVSLVPRGGGTGTNGQSLTDGVIVDLSRHMNRILEINAGERWAWVEAGVVKDQLNDAVRKHGLFFAPELSPSNRATFGGMIATDASGQGSVLYGKTRNHVLELKTVLTDGTHWHSRPLEEGELESTKQRPDRVGEIHRVLDAIDRDHRAEIEHRLPRLNRCVTGYDLAHIRDERRRLNLSSILCGAEGTLGFVTEAKINLVPIPRFSALVNIRYAAFDAALRDARKLMAMEAASSETIDGKVLGLAREDAVWLTVKKFFPEDPEGTQGVNLVEFLSDDEVALEQKVARIVAMLDGEQGQGGRRGFTVARDHADIVAIWSMRKKSVGLLGNTPGEKRPIPFVEDTVVPPEHLADYIAEFRAMLDRHGLEYGMFGHVDAGCLHVRPAIDMKDAAQEHLIRSISDQVFALTGKYKGLLWGEHGKGVRSEYAPEFFGPLYPLLQKIKSAFDPRNQLNPGKIAAPEGKALLKIDAVVTRGQLDRTIPLHVRAANADSLHCNGNAACYNFDPDDAMCPSWKATRQRRHSPKGRASLMREWLRLLAKAGSDPVAEAERLRRQSSWLRWPARALNALAPGSRDDFSHAVKEAMDGCLACKSCSGQCPIKVDVPSFRSRFLELYHGRYPRPPRDYLVASIEFCLPWLARAPALYNALVSSAPGRAILGALGLVSLPRMSNGEIASDLAARGVREASAAALAAIPALERPKHLVVVQDAFTTHFEGGLVTAFCDLAQRLGFQPWLAPYRPNGKPMHVLGFLRGFHRVADRNAGMLNALAATGVPLVGLDPSMTLTYRFEYAKALPSATAPKVMLPQEWLAARMDDLPKVESRGSITYLLMPHCTERTNAPGALALWPTLFRRFGFDLKIVATGCCGMAGLYGHEARNRATSESIYRLSWARRVSQPGSAGRLLATGYSCRSQAAHIDGVALPHPVTVLLAALKEERLAPPKVETDERAVFVDAHHEDY